ncbi:efflux RND transporter permease subunit, partial [Gilvimarinus sp. 1_MG-2023]
TTPYQGAMYTGYRAILKTMLKYRALSTILMVMMMVVAVLGFGQVKQAFFPPSNTPIFLVDIWLPEGSDILATQQQARQLEQWLLQQPGVEFTSSTVGRGEVRFMLTYDVEKEYAAFAQVL